MKNLYFSKVDGMALCLGVKSVFRSCVELEDQKVIVVLSDNKADSVTIDMTDLDNCFAENAESLFFGSGFYCNNSFSSNSDVVLGWIEVKKTDKVQSCNNTTSENLYKVNDYGTFKSINNIGDSEKLLYILPEVTDDELVVNVGSPVFKTLKKMSISCTERVQLCFKCNKNKIFEYVDTEGNKCMIPVNVKIQITDNGLLSESFVIKVDECSYDSIDPESSFYTEADIENYLIVLTEKL